MFVLTDLPEAETFLSINASSNMVNTEDSLQTDIVTASLDWRCAARDVPRMFERYLQNACKMPSREAIARADGCTKARQLSKLLVLAADCVWLPELVAPFLETLRALRAHVPWTWQVCVLLAYKSRSTAVDEALFAGLRGTFAVQLVPQVVGEQRGSVQLWVASARGGAEPADLARLSEAQ